MVCCLYVVIISFVVLLVIRCVGLCWIGVAFCTLCICLSFGSLVDVVLYCIVWCFGLAGCGFDSLCGCLIELLGGLLGCLVSCSSWWVLLMMMLVGFSCLLGVCWFTCLLLCRLFIAWFV